MLGLLSQVPVAFHRRALANALVVICSFSLMLSVAIAPDLAAQNQTAIAYACYCAYITLVTFLSSSRMLSNVSWWRIFIFSAATVSLLVDLFLFLVGSIHIQSFTTRPCGPGEQSLGYFTDYSCIPDPVSSRIFDVLTLFSACLLLIISIALYQRYRELDDRSGRLT